MCADLTSTASNQSESSLSNSVIFAVHSSAHHVTILLKAHKKQDSPPSLNRFYTIQNDGSTMTAAGLVFDQHSPAAKDGKNSR